MYKTRSKIWDFNYHSLNCFVSFSRILTIQKMMCGFGSDPNLPMVSLEKSSRQVAQAARKLLYQRFQISAASTIFGFPGRCWGNFRIWMFGGNIHKNLWWFIGPFLRFPWDFLLALIPCGNIMTTDFDIYIYIILGLNMINSIEAGRRCLTHPPGMWKSSVLYINRVSGSRNQEKFESEDVCQIVAIQLLSPPEINRIRELNRREFKLMEWFYPNKNLNGNKWLCFN